MQRSVEKFKSEAGDNGRGGRSGDAGGERERGTDTRRGPPL